MPLSRNSGTTASLQAGRTRGRGRRRVSGRMKRAAGRPKDLIEVEILAALRDELAGGADSRG